MTKRIAETGGVSRHFDAITYLNKLSAEWKLRAAGEPYELTLALIGEWRRWRQEIAECRGSVESYSPMLNKSLPVRTSSHSTVLQTVGEIILNLESEYGWPAPAQPLVRAHDIERLRECVRELEACREKVRWNR
jgi:hypothetical protein